MTFALLAMSFVPMLFETRLAARHERALRAAGAFEPPGDVYGVMRIAYPACFLVMCLEGWSRVSGADALFALGASVFALAKALKYWAIATLGDRWTFRVLVPPDSRAITRGPYRMMRHPNYIGVLGELLGMGLMAHAAVSGTASLVGFGALIAARIRVEDRALGGRGRGRVGAARGVGRSPTRR